MLPTQTERCGRVGVIDYSTSQAVEGIKWSAFARLSSRGIQFITSLLVARLLLPSEFGLYSIAIVITGFIQELADGGVSNAILRDRSLARNSLAALLWLNVALGLVLFSGLFLAAPSITRWYNEPDLLSVLRYLSVGFLIAPVGDFLSWLLRRDLKFRDIARVELFSSLTWLFATTTLAALGFGVNSLVYGFLVRSSLRAALYVAVAGEHRRLMQVPLKLDALAGHSFLMRFASFQLLERAVYFLASNVDFVVIGLVLGTERLGYYALAYNIVIGVVRVVNPILQNVAFPVLSLRKDNLARIKAGYLKLIETLSALILPAMIGCSVLAPIIIDVIYGERWAASASTLRILAIYGISYSIRCVTFDLLKIIGRPDLSFYYNFIGLTVLVGAAVVGARVGGTEGVALGLLTASVAVLLPVDFLIRRKHVPTTFPEFFAKVAPALGAATIMGLGVLVLLWVFPASVPVAKLFLGCAVAIVIYVAALSVFARDFVTEAWALSRDSLLLSRPQSP